MIASEPTANEHDGPFGAPVTVDPSNPRNRLADELRRVISIAVGKELSDSDLDSAADQVSRLADQLEGATRPGKRPRGQPNVQGHPQDLFPTSPVVGYSNPIAPPVRFWAVPGEGGILEMRGRAVFGYAYEGPPTCVHGGVIAELFDELLGSTNIITGHAGMTGTLSIKYKKPTPILAPLDLEARQTSIEGRKIYAWGGIYHDGILTAEADGIFIELQQERMLAIVQENSERSTEEVVDAQLREYMEAGGGIVASD